jgi:hypothetical protein
MFDINTLSQTAIQAQLDTAITPYPEMEAIVQIDLSDKGLQWSGGQTAAKDGKPSRTWARLDLRCRIIRSETVDLLQVSKERGTPVDEMYIKYGIMLDLTEQGALDTGPGRNVKLGALREAVDQNDPDQSWHYDMLKGQAFKAKINITVDREDETKRYNNIVSVAHI